MEKIMLALTIIMMSGCGHLVQKQCLQLQSGQVSAKYDKIKRIAIEEAKNNGFDGLPNENKPSKYNDYVGQLLFQLKTADGTDSLFVRFNHDNVCISGAGMVARPDTALKAIFDRYQHL